MEGSTGGAVGQWGSGAAGAWWWRRGGASPIDLQLHRLARLGGDGEGDAAEVSELLAAVRPSEGEAAGVVGVRLDRGDSVHGHTPVSREQG